MTVGRSGEAGRYRAPRVTLNRYLDLMAIVRRFIHGDHNVKDPKTEVDAYVQKVVAGDGTEYLYLYNFAAGGRKPGDTPTQSLHFDYSAAKAFKALLDETFGPL